MDPCFQCYRQEGSSTTVTEKGGTDGWGDWGDSDFTSTLDNPDVTPASAYAWGANNSSESDFFSSLGNQTEKVRIGMSF